MKCCTGSSTVTRSRLSRLVAPEVHPAVAKALHGLSRAVATTSAADQHVHLNAVEAQ